MMDVYDDAPHSNDHLHGSAQTQADVARVSGLAPIRGCRRVRRAHIREGLEIVQYPDYQGHNALPDEYLVQELALAKAVPNDIWIRNGFYPLSDWEHVR